MNPKKFEFSLWLLRIKIWPKFARLSPMVFGALLCVFWLIACCPRLIAQPVEPNVAGLVYRVDARTTVTIYVVWNSEDKLLFMFAKSITSDTDLTDGMGANYMQGEFRLKVLGASLVFPSENPGYLIQEREGKLVMVHRTDLTMKRLQQCVSAAKNQQKEIHIEDIK